MERARIQSGSLSVRWIVTTALVAAALVAVMVLAPRPQQGQAADGSVFTLEEARLVRKGGSYRYLEPGGTGLRRFFPKATGVEASAEADTMFFRLHKRGGPDYRVGRHVWWVTDHHGCRFRAFGTWDRIGLPPNAPTPVTPPSELGAQVSASVFPRRGEPIVLGYYRLVDEAPLVRFHARNPAGGPFPEWTPEPYPIRKRDGGATLILNAIRWTDTPGLGDAVALLSVSENGELARDWIPAGVEVSDATGNSAGYVMDPALPPGEVRVPALCAREAAWKVNAEFARPRPERIKPDFQLVAIGIPVPAAGRVSHASGVVARGGGYTARLMGVAGTGPVEWEPGHSWSGGRYPYARLVVEPLTPGLQMSLVTATDERGWDALVRKPGVPELDSSGSWSQIVRPTGGTQGYRFDINPKPGAKFLNLTFRFHRTRKAEFLAKP
jgi:hypothetical protein